VAADNPHNHERRRADSYTDEDTNADKDAHEHADANADAGAPDGDGHRYASNADIDNYAALRVPPDEHADEGSDEDPEVLEAAMTSQSEMTPRLEAGCRVSRFSSPSTPCQKGGSWPFQSRGDFTTSEDSSTPLGPGVVERFTRSRSVDEGGAVLSLECAFSLDLPPIPLLVRRSGPSDPEVETISRSAVRPEQPMTGSFSPEFAHLRVLLSAIGCSDRIRSRGGG
jgi:hypothetical protein